ncbi:MAG: histidine phosphatase family protein [Cyanobacteria bacterium P01_E01_bin.6]
MVWLRILLIRHALSFGNTTRQMMGQLDDRLVPEGVVQAHHLLSHLAEHGDKPTMLYSSPIARAAQTAEILAAPFGVDIHYCADLKELHNGIFQGLTWHQAMQHHGQLCQRLEASMDWVPIPGSESPQEGRERANRCIQYWLANHSNGDYIWVVSHAGLMQHLISAFLSSDRTWGLSIPNTSVFEFWGDRQRWFSHGQNRWNTELWKIHRFNDTRHLP